MLRSEILSAKEIAQELGYPDYASFSKQFKKFTEKSPSEIKDGKVSESLFD